MQSFPCIAVCFTFCFLVHGAPSPQDEPRRHEKSFFEEQKNGDTHSVSVGLLGGRIGNQIINAGGKILGFDIFQRSPDDRKDAAGAVTSNGIRESGGHASAIESSVGVAGDNLKLGGKYLTAGVESGLGNGFKAIVRGSVADGTMQAGPLKIGTSFGNLDTGVSGDISGLEAKLLGNGATIKSDKLELCVYNVCGSVDPSPVTRLFTGTGR